MPIGIKTTEVVDITSATAAINTAVTDANAFHCHRFFFEIDAAASVQLQGSYDGVVWFDLLASAVTTDGEVKELDRPWQHLRVSVTGNTGNATVTLQQFYSNMSGAI